MGVSLFWQPAIDGCYLILCFKVVWQNKILSCLVLLIILDIPFHYFFIFN